MYIKTRLDYPGGPVDKNPPTKAEDLGSIQVGKMSLPRGYQACALQVLSTCSRACAPRQGQPLQREARAPQLESSP